MSPSSDSDSSLSPPPPLPDDLISQHDARGYWQSAAADLGGMLGGVDNYPALSKVDLQGSRAFLAKLGIGRKSGLRRVKRAVDCGAGIGRITLGLLIDVADTVDVVEPIAKFTKELEGKQGVGRIFNVGLEGWPVTAGGGHGGEGGDDDDHNDNDDGEGGDKDNDHDGGEQQQQQLYSLVWIQWCAGQLRDAQLVDFLHRCKGRLSDDGVVVIKENNTTGGVDIFDELDSSVTRQDASFRKLFEAAGMKLVRTRLQTPFPKELFPVRMYALRPE